MRSQTLIRAFLETLRELTRCDSVNLYFPANYSLGLSEQVYRSGKESLVEFSQSEFDPQQFEKLTLPSLDKQYVTFNGVQTGTLLIGLRTTEFAQTGIDAEVEFSRRKSVSSVEADPICWIGLKYQQSLPEWLLATNNKDTPTTPIKLLNHTLHLAAVQMSQLESDNALLIDPLTCLPSRTKFQSQLAQLCQQHSNVAVLMIHANEFHNINKKYGHEHGDKVIWEISQHLLDSIRESDLVSRFGGALFAIAAPFEEQQQILALGEKLQSSLQHPQYLSGELTLGFNIGIGTNQANDHFATQVERVANVINKADQALKASQIKSLPAVTLWQQEQMDSYAQQADYIGGIFTADTATDYRNMLLLWDISNIIASQNQFEELLQLVVQRLAQTFDFQFCGIFDNAEPLNIHTAFTLNELARALPTKVINAPALALVTRATEQVSQTIKPKYAESSELVAFAAPLDELGHQSFFLCGQIEKFAITHDGQMLFAALTKQLGRALNRARLEQRLNEQLEQQKQQLQEELAELKHGLSSSNMYYCSQAMELLMKQAKRAAMTDTTTLIIGESGTGKERLVHSLHGMGNRNDKPLVVVDCGAIPETLIESELFGHVKGAFTGAQNASKGKVHEAHGGTLMLDEIGELPLRMQTKLLRFVQEKQFTPVGGTKTETVDVKIIAVTNRELEQEVALGNFRQDLYYRLNVLTLRTPPLRERPDDIPLLSKHFLKKFAQQFGHETKNLTPLATHHMLAYQWPGNIRELENRLMQANLLSESATIDWPDLKIDQAEQGIERSPVPVNQVSVSAPRTAIPDAKPTSPALVSLNKTEYLEHLRNQLAQRVKGIVENEDISLFPIGNWLEEDTIELAYECLDNNVKKVASRLGTSISTTRRKLEKIKHQYVPPQQKSSPHWQPIKNDLLPIANGQVNLGPDGMTTLQLSLLQVLLQNKSLNMNAVSVLMGISEPTMYKLKKRLKQSLQEEISE